MKSVLEFLLILAAWLYLLRILRKAGLRWWTFLFGSVGMFILMMIGVRPFLTEPLAKCVCAMSGIVGTLTKTFTPFFKYGIIYVPCANESVTLMIDMECSGIIEIMAFISLLTFFNVYNRTEKFTIGLIGFSYIMICNALRIVIIAEAVHFFGMDAYTIAHTFVGRIFFYICSILLYFYVFTKPQVLKMKVGNFSYGHNKTNS